MAAHHRAAGKHMRTGQQRSYSIRDLLLNFGKSSTSNSFRASASTYCATTPASVSRDGIFLDFLLPPSVFPLPVYTRYAYHESIRPSYFRPSYKDFKIECSKSWDALKACSSGQTHQLFSYLSGRLPFDRHPKGIGTRLNDYTNQTASFSVTTNTSQQAVIRQPFPECVDFSDALSSTPVGIAFDATQTPLAAQVHNLDVFEDLHITYKNSDRSPASRTRFLQTLLAKTRPLCCSDPTNSSRVQDACSFLLSLQDTTRRPLNQTEAEIQTLQRLLLQSSIRFFGNQWKTRRPHVERVQEMARLFYLRGSKEDSLTIFQEASFSCSPEDYLRQFVVRHDVKYEYLHLSTAQKEGFPRVWNSLIDRQTPSSVFPYRMLGHTLGQAIPVEAQTCINTLLDNAQGPSLHRPARQRYYSRAATLATSTGLEDDTSLPSSSRIPADEATAFADNRIKVGQYREAWQILRFSDNAPSLLEDHGAHWPQIALAAYTNNVERAKRLRSSKTLDAIRESVQRDQIQDALVLLQSEYPPDRQIEWYLAVMAGLVKRADVRKAEELWEDMNRQPQIRLKIVPHNPKIWTQMLSVYVKRGDWNGAVQFFAKAQKARVRVDLFMWTTMMNVYVNINQYSKAMDIFEQLRQSSASRLKPDIAAYNVALKCLMLSGAPIKRLLDVVSTLPDLKMQPDQVTITALLQAAASGGHIATAESIFAQADKSKSLVQLNAHHFAIMIKTFLDNGEKEAARLYLNEMQRRNLADTSVFAANLVNAYLTDEDGPDMEQAEEVITEYSKRSAPRRARGYDKPADQREAYSTLLSPVIHHYAKTRKAANALQIFERIGKQGEQPTIIAYSSLLDAYRREGNIEAVLQIWDATFERACQDSSTAATDDSTSEPLQVRGGQLCMPLSIVIQALAGVDRHDEIVDRWVQVQDSGFGFDTANWNHLCQATIRAQQLQHALWIVETVLLPEDSRSSKPSDPIVGKRRLRELFDPLLGEQVSEEEEDKTGEEALDEVAEHRTDSNSLFKVEDPDAFAVYRQTLDMLADAIYSRSGRIGSVDELVKKYPRAIEACNNRDLSNTRRAHEKRTSSLVIQ